MTCAAIPLRMTLKLQQQFKKIIIHQLSFMEKVHFSFLSSIFIIYEHKDLTQTLYCCFIRAKALCSSLFALDFVLNCKVTV